MSNPLGIASPPSVLITSGPTQEPIDAVRFVGNRSSGRLGVALASEAHRRGCPVTLLLGPVSVLPTDTGISVRRFRTCADLQGLLRDAAPAAEILIMAAAVADYRPRIDPASLQTKVRRTDAGLTLEMEPTPDLLAEVAAGRRAGQTLVGFALEPREALEASAKAKLTRKRVDLIVANPLETMDSATIDATLYAPGGVVGRTPGPIAKEAFAAWLLDAVLSVHAASRV